MFRAGGIPRGVPLDSTRPQVHLADISEFQPDIADATYLAWSKAIIIRAMYGDAHDDGAWYGGVRRDALHAGGAQFLGIYQYLVASQDAATQARALVSLLGPLRPGEIPICDLEEGNGDQAGRWEAWRQVILAAYPQLAHTPSGSPWLYSGLDYAATHNLRPQWVAAYQATAPSMPHVLWQFSSSYPVPGVGLADCSVYLGSVSELRALITATVPKPPPPHTTGDATMYVDRQLTEGQAGQASWPAGNVKQVIVVNGTGTAGTAAYRWRHAAGWYPAFSEKPLTLPLPAGGLTGLTTTPPKNMDDVDAVQVTVTGTSLASMHSIDG